MTAGNARSAAKARTDSTTPSLPRTSSSHIVGVFVTEGAAKIAAEAERVTLRAEGHAVFNDDREGRYCAYCGEECATTPEGDLLACPTTHREGDEAWCDHCGAELTDHGTCIGDIYQGLSHIHKHQTIGTAVYAGSIARLDFAERELKGIVEVEYQRDGTTWEHRWRFVPLNVPKMIHVDGVLTREGFEFASIDGDPVLLEPPDHAARSEFWAGADIKVTYRFVIQRWPSIRPR